MVTPSPWYHSFPVKQGPGPVAKRNHKSRKPQWWLLNQHVLSPALEAFELPIVHIGCVTLLNSLFEKVGRHLKSSRRFFFSASREYYFASLLLSSLWFWLLGIFPHFLLFHCPPTLVWKSKTKSQNSLSSILIHLAFLPLLKSCQLDFTDSRYKEVWEDRKEGFQNWSWFFVWDRVLLVVTNPQPHPPLPFLSFKMFSNTYRPPFLFTTALIIY